MPQAIVTKNELKAASYMYQTFEFQSYSILSSKVFTANKNKVGDKEFRKHQS